MHKQLTNALKKMSESDFRQLALHISTAEMCRSIMKQYGVTDQQMAEKLKLSPLKFKYFKIGAYEYSIRDWATLQSIEYQLGCDMLEKKIAEQIQIPDYKPTNNAK